MIIDSTLTAHSPRFPSQNLSDFPIGMRTAVCLTLTPGVLPKVVPQPQALTPVLALAVEPAMVLVKHISLCQLAISLDHIQSN